jgi:hypothetical protein
VATPCVIIDRERRVHVLGNAMNGCDRRMM